jgi:hypothetical protein
MDVTLPVWFTSHTAGMAADYAVSPEVTTGAHAPRALRSWLWTPGRPRAAEVRGAGRGVRTGTLRENHE